MRCIAHIINLVVVEGLKEVGDSVMRVRAAVRYVRSSPARLKKFKDCVEAEKIECKSGLCLDVSTRWNSTYLMLHTAEKFERAFERYEDVEPHFKLELIGDNGVPNSMDYDTVRKMANLLGQFYELTLRISGSLYMTSNIFFNEINDVDYVLQEWEKSDDIDLRLMGGKMKSKFDKYWGDIDKMNKLIYIAVALDP
jgi:hypothetical protein